MVRLLGDRIAFVRADVEQWIQERIAAGEAKWWITHIMNEWRKK